jgi:hypothetical protein
MRKLFTCLAAVALVGFGYVLGAGGLLSPKALFAQAEKAEPSAAETTGASADALAKIKAADDALKAAAEALEQEGLYVPATKGLNLFAITSGGIDALKDLEGGHGVDPETFAGLYAGLATDDIVSKLGRDSENRITYNNKLVRMYPVSRLKKLFAAREAIAGEKGGDGEKKPAKPAEETAQ